MTSYDFVLPRSYKATFPNKCVVCQGVPDRTVRMIHSGANPLVAFWAPIAHLFSLKSLEAPICRKCKPRFQWERLVRALILIGLAIYVISEFYPFFEHWSSTGRKLAITGIALFFIMPYLLIEMKWPPPFQIDSSPDHVTYEFTSEEYAQEFYELNKENILNAE